MCVCPILYIICNIQTFGTLDYRILLKNINVPKGWDITPKKTMLTYIYIYIYPFVSGTALNPSLW